MTHSKPTLRDLFETALSLPAAERTAYLDEQCRDPVQRADVERLLAADAAPDARLLEVPLDDLLERVGDPGEQMPDVGTQVGPFILLDELGRGGSSIVFRAEREQAGVRQKVALKLLRRGLYSADEKRRFRAERQALAQLQHPGIARLIEGGIAESGVPYIALELVDGVPITEHVRHRQLGLRDRLGLFVAVCRAVEAAHRSLIVHRDLKPSNVLVTGEGEVKLLDFGIAKLLDAEADDGTQTQHQAMTPAYAAPEQHGKGPITTATDVYALGVLLGELVTGQRRAVGDESTPSSQISVDSDPGVLPAPPRITRRLLRGDVDNIVLRATALKPERRYASAGALADDVERFLDGRPVAAHPPSSWYRVRRFVGRHKAGVVTTAMFVLAVFAALGTALWQAAVARAQADRAEAMRGFLFTAFAQTEPGKPRAGPPSVTEVVDQAIRNARDDRTMSAPVRVELLTELGRVLGSQRALEPAQKVLVQNYADAQQTLGRSSPLTLRAGFQLVFVQTLAGNFTAARPLADQLLAELPPGDSALRCEALAASAYLAYWQGDTTRALAEGKENLRLARAQGDADLLLLALDANIGIRYSANELADAQALAEEYLERLVARYGPQHIEASKAHSANARIQNRIGDLARAEEHVRAALAIDVAALPKDHAIHANHLNTLTGILLRQRHYDRALESEAEALRINRIALADDSPEITTNLGSIGFLHIQMEDYAGAVAPLREALARSEAKLDGRAVDTQTTRSGYGWALAESGDASAGLAEIRKAIGVLHSLETPNPDMEARAWERLALAQIDLQQAEAALASIASLESLLATIEKRNARWDGRTGIMRARALLDLGQPAAAQPQLEDAAIALAASKHPEEMLTVELPLLRADAALRLGDKAAAAQAAADGTQRLAGMRFPPQRLRLLDEHLQAQVGAAR